jgi:peptidyl-tRNA hydrolase, PTH1 family
MWLIVGLGNPGTQYALTRHNIGFMAVDFLAHGLQASPFKTDHKAQLTKVDSQGENLILLKPQTFMNLSGQSVVSAMNFYKIPLDNILVVQDDIDQPFGSIRYHKNRGHGGHNGIRNISELLGTADYTRLKLGVGRPPHPQMNVADYVLQKFNDQEQAELPDFLNKACDSIEYFIKEGLQKTSTKFNS